MKELATLNANSDTWPAMIQQRIRMEPTRGHAAHRGLDDTVSGPCAKGVIDGVNHHFRCHKASCPCECHKGGQ